MYLSTVSGEVQSSNRIVYPTSCGSYLTVFFRHTLGHRHGRHTAGLRAPDDAAAREPHLRHVLRHLGRLAGTGLSDHHQ
ncbi:unnamed protein product, partial [Ectocarpus sp. 8 AP-2014]